MKTETKKILIYRLGSLGDTIIALPCFNRIKELYPGGEITLLTNKPVVLKAAPLEAILGKDFFYDRILNYSVGTRSLKVLFNLFKEIRRHKFDVIINIAATRSRKATIRDKYFFKLAGVKDLVGFPTVDEDFKVSIDPNTNEYEWEAKRLARRIEVLGPFELDADHYWDLHLTINELNEGAEIIKNIVAPIIVVSAGTKVQSKDWGDENWSNLVGKLKVDLPGWQLILLGSPDESPRAEKCRTQWDDNAINLCGKTSPRISAAIMKAAKVFVGHDSGPMHLAACVGVPCVAIFAARNLPRQWFPRGSNNKIVYHKTDCAGCGLEICIEQQKKCILSITVDEVRGAILDVVKNGESI